MSQYASSITGDVVFDMRCISNHIVDFAKENYPKSNMQDSSIIYPSEASYATNHIYRMDSGKRLFDQPSIYLNNYGLSSIFTNTIPVNSDITMSLWVYPTTIGTRYSFFKITYDDAGYHKNYIEFTYSYDYYGNGDICASLYHDPNFTVLDTLTKVTLNTWNHLGLTWEGDVLRVYLNGNKIYQQNITKEAVSLSSTTISCMKQDASYIGEAVVILNQALWTGDSFEVPNTFLTGEKEFEDKYVIYTAPMNGWPNITGDVLVDIRSDRGIIYDIARNAALKKENMSNKGIVSLQQNPQRVAIIKEEYKNFKNSIKITPTGIVRLRGGSTNIGTKFTASIYVKIVKLNLTTLNDQEGCLGLAVRTNAGTTWEGATIYASIATGNPSLSLYRQLLYGNNGVLTGIFTEAISEYSGNSLLGTWVHCAIVKDGKQLYYFIDGNLKYQYTCDYETRITGMPLETGFGPYYDTQNINNIDFRFLNMVFINNQALWTSNFTPPVGYLSDDKITFSTLLIAKNNFSSIQSY